MNLGKVEIKLSTDIFFRLSRSVIINTNFLTSVNKGKRICLLKVIENKYEFHIHIPIPLPKRLLRPIHHILRMIIRAMSALLLFLY